MNEKELLTQEDVNKAFEAGEVYNAPDQMLIEYLRVLCTGYISNEMVRHRETNRCITINTLINIRLIKKIDRFNTWLVSIGIALALIGVVTSIIQALK